MTPIVLICAVAKVNDEMKACAVPKRRPWSHQARLSIPIKSGRQGLKAMPKLPSSINQATDDQARMTRSGNNGIVTP